MKLDGATTTASAATVASPATAVRAERKVDPQRTAVTRADMRGAIKRALTQANGGTAPADGLVEVLTAHASLETASGASMYNFNFGGIKGHAPDGGIAALRTKEVINGNEVTIRDGYRAYKTLDAGAADYVRTMQGRFSGALAPAARGDVAGFAGALKSAGYYTASQADYTAGLTRLMGASGASGSATSSTSAAAPFGGSPSVVRPLDGSGSASSFGLTSAGLSRVADALDADRFYGAFSPSHPKPHSESEDDDTA